MPYLTDSYMVFTLKMESVSKNTTFGLKMIVKSGLEKIVLKFLHAGDYFPLLHKSAKNLPAFTIIFRLKTVFLDTDSILRVNLMYQSSKMC